MSSWRKALTLPGKRDEGSDEFASALASRAPHRPQPADGDYILAAPQPPAPDAGARTRRDQQAPTARPGVAEAGWDEEREGSGRARRAGKIGLWVVVGLLAVGGARAAFFPPAPTVVHDKGSSQSADAKDGVPDGEAQQVAARFARSYLTWSQADPQSRAKELARDLPKGADSKAGWDGQGNQLVAQAIPGSVTQTRAHQARVAVDVRVSTTTGTGKKARVSSSWQRLEVPVADRGGRVLVTGEPALVGLRGPVAWTAPQPAASDDALSKQTRSSATAFFKAWVAGTEDQATAPGARIAPLGGGFTFDSLTEWDVAKGTGSHRTALARVTWDVAGAELEQTYRVTLAEVSASGASRWQVWQVTAQ